VKGNPRTGWAIILTIEDLAQILEPPYPESDGQLVLAWEENWSILAEQVDARDALRAAFDEMRQQTLALLRMLD